MPWILKNKKKLVFYSGGFVLLIVLASILSNSLFITAIIYVSYFFIMVLNEIVRIKMNKTRELFDIFSSVRNIDYLIIGDFCVARDYVPNKSSYVQIFAPGRGYNSAYQILRHTHSILKEEKGVVIMTIGESKKDFTIFDVPFLCSLTIKKYNLEDLCKKSKFPVIFAPINSIRFLGGGGVLVMHTNMQRIFQMS